jgi:protein-S-isoprenylcysteine O-methyltransferase Ste14
MTTTPQSGSPLNVERDTTNLGLVRPPLVYLVSLVVGVLLQLTIPLPFFPRTLATPLGATLVAVAITLFSYWVMEYRAARTPVPARKPTTVIVRTGPYRFSRNPIYLAFSLCNWASGLGSIVYGRWGRWLGRWRSSIMW